MDHVIILTFEILAKQLDQYQLAKWAKTPDILDQKSEDLDVLRSTRSGVPCRFQKVSPPLFYGQAPSGPLFLVEPTGSHGLMYLNHVF